MQNGTRREDACKAVSHLQYGDNCFAHKRSLGFLDATICKDTAKATTKTVCTTVNIQSFTFGRRAAMRSASFSGSDVATDSSSLTVLYLAAAADAHLREGMCVLVGSGQSTRLRCTHSTGRVTGCTVVNFGIRQ